MRRPLAVLAATVIAIGAYASTVASWHRAAIERGRALFEGSTQLVGTLAGQVEMLPTVATRCVNCHKANDPGEAPAYGGRLDQLALTQLRSRHGGPASSYNLRTFCALLRTGQDPAYVIISPAMPRYQPTEHACADLWAYLQTR